MTVERKNQFRRPGFLVAAVVVGLLVLAAVAVVVSVLARGANGPSAQPATTTANPTPSVDAADASVCGLEGFETTDTLTQAPDNEWELVGTVAAPTDPSGAGPGLIVDGLRTCFAHTSEGALFMAVNFAAMGTDASLRDRLPELVAPGPDREALLAENSSDSGASFRAQVAGFSIGAYTRNEAVVDIAVNYSSGELVSLPLKLVWVEGDWKIQMTEEGALPLSPAPIPNLGGYTPWSGA